MRQKANIEFNPNSNLLFFQYFFVKTIRPYKSRHLIEKQRVPNAQKLALKQNIEQFSNSLIH